MINQVKRKTAPLNFQSNSGTGFPVSVKIRIHSDLSKTVEFAKRAEKCGADWITVHGRTQKQRSSEPVDYNAIKLIKECVSIPVFANGDIYTIQDADSVVENTNVDGVMCARGLLENPAMFSGYVTTPVECLQKYVRNALELGTTHFIFHHHLIYMLEKSMSKAEKKAFNVLSSIPAVLDYLEEHYGIFC